MPEALWPVVIMAVVAAIALALGIASIAVDNAHAPPALEAEPTPFPSHSFHSTPEDRNP